MKTKDEQLIEATNQKKIADISRLLNEGANINARDTAGRTSLIYAAQNGDIEIINILLNNNADIDALTQGGSTALAMASCYRHVEVVHLLLHKGANPNIGRETALNFAQDESIVKSLLAYGASPHAFDQTQSPSLVAWGMWAYRHCFAPEEGIDWLLEAGADINATNQYASTALNNALQHDNFDFARALLKKGANKEHLSPNNIGIEPKYAQMTPLLWIIAESQTLYPHQNQTLLKKIQLLCDAGVNINAQSAGGYTALMLVVENHNRQIQQDIINELLDRGADTTLKNANHQTALDIAKQLGKNEAIALLRHINVFQKRLKKINFSETKLDQEERAEYAALHCPISQEIMSEPILLSSGKTYDRYSLISYFEHLGRPVKIPDPLTRQQIYSSELDDSKNLNLTMKHNIETFVCRQENKQIFSNILKASIFSKKLYDSVENTIEERKDFDFFCSKMQK